MKIKKEIGKLQSKISVILDKITTLQQKCSHSKFTERMGNYGDYDDMYKGPYYVDYSCSDCGHRWRKNLCLTSIDSKNS